MFSRDFNEFLQLLNSHKVRYLIIGGYAVAFHGHPRFTKDLDVWLDASVANAKRVIAALNEFGFASMGMTVEDFVQSDKIIQLGFPPVRIDLLIGIRSLSFRKAYANRVVADSNGVAVNFISLEGLLESKRKAGRPQDIADIEQLGSPSDLHAGQ